MHQPLFAEHKANIDYFFEHVDPAAVDRMVELAMGCDGLLIFSGVGKSGLIAEKLAATMLSTGTRAIYLPPTNALHGDLGIISERDICIFISKSGETEELKVLLPMVHARGARLVSWVCESDSTLAREADHTVLLPVKRELCPFDLAPTTSTAVQLIFGDIVSIALMRAKSISLDEYALNHPAGSIGKRATTRVADIMVRSEALPLCGPNDLVGALLPELTTKRLGCLLVVDADDHLLGIFTDGDLRRAIQSEGSDLLTRSIGELITRDCLTITPDALAYGVMQQMQGDPDRWVTLLPVVEESRLVGLLHMHDIVHAGAR